MEICAYLTFNGNCREAMNFYQQCLGGELQFQTVGDSPLTDKMPQSMKEAVLHASLTNSDIKILASDMVSGKGLKKGNNMALMLNCKDEYQLKSLYEDLSEDGEKTHLLENTFFGGITGDLVDKYGINWILYCEIETSHLQTEI